MTGPENVSSVTGSLDIGYNDTLASLPGMNYLTAIQGNLRVRDNDALTDLSRLKNIDAGSIADLSIFDNNSLSVCAVESICDYLAGPNGTITIYNNAFGCDNPSQVADVCGYQFIACQGV